MSHCAQDLTCPNRCRCSEELKAELEAELALLDAQDDGQGIVPEPPESPADPVSEPPRGIRGLVTTLRFRGNQQ